MTGLQLEPGPHCVVELGGGTLGVLGEDSRTVLRGLGPVPMCFRGPLRYPEG